jgi:hypothetical protein
MYGVTWNDKLHKEELLRPAISLPPPPPLDQCVGVCSVPREPDEKRLRRNLGARMMLSYHGIELWTPKPAMPSPIERLPVLVTVTGGSVCFLVCCTISTELTEWTADWGGGGGGTCPWPSFHIFHLCNFWVEVGEIRGSMPVLKVVFWPYLVIHKIRGRHEM